MDDRRDLSRWLLDNERKAILPFKWALFSVAAVLWLWKTRWMLPSIECFAVFQVYLLFLLADTYLLVMRRVTVSEARMMCVTSFLIDLVFVSVLIYFDNKRMIQAGRGEMSDYYYLFFVLAMRGYSLSTSQVFNLAINLLVVFLLIVSFALSEMSFGFLLNERFQIRLAFLWLIILMSWYIVGLISQQKEELMATRERLLKTQHLADLGEMAAVVAHEVNNPIGIISANAEFLMKQTGEDDERRDDYRVIRDESQRCKRIVSELLSYARPARDVKIEEVDLAELCRDVVGFAFRRKTREEPEVEVTVEDGLPHVLADPSSLRQALLNVLINARQATKGQGGAVGIRLSPVGGRNAMVELSVSDNGSGISEEDVERAFDPFFTRRHGGTGLGLAVTKRIVEDQGGSVSIAPRKDTSGATVTIRLPKAT